ncbi:hypothetical protein GCM10009828_032900 [Actinoplanes couchii]|uniref:Uncharacterized protein n=1 Tax=Actinoplanes couchii TaxID=403638 RepID=A0ABQ3XBA0_9ACTN|nr:hypothetical protein Aco03nite_041490 [Actinoplanes couchii]
MFGRTCGPDGTGLGGTGPGGTDTTGDGDAGWAAAGVPACSELALQPAVISSDATSAVYRRERNDMARRQLHRRWGDFRRVVGQVVLDPRQVAYPKYR